MNQQGMSFIELIVASLMVSVLATLSLNSYNVFVDATYDNHALQYLNDVTRALEAGRVEYNMESPMPIEIYSDDYGDDAPSVFLTTKDKLLPGMNVDSKISLDIIVFPGCFVGDGWKPVAPGNPCPMDSITIHHCKSSTKYTLTHYGEENSILFPDAEDPTC